MHKSKAKQVFNGQHFYYIIELEITWKVMNTPRRHPVTVIAN